MSGVIKRKPVPSTGQNHEQSQRALEQEDDDPPPPYSTSQEHMPSETPIVEGEARPDLDEQLENLQLQTADATLSSSSLANGVVLESAAAVEYMQEPSKFKRALGEVKYFAGGLITRPYEATKHYSILRHSHGLVWYQGPSTSVAITIFSDQAILPDRKLWLQKRGFSGKTGLNVGAAIGTRSAWIDVTPGSEVTSNQLQHDDERAWQRDITKFLKKAKDVKNVCNHLPRQTAVVRIPHAADDGYFRIVLCVGRKVLCPSPIFRYASSSTDLSVLRGASLGTLPLELGIKVGSKVANYAANVAAHGAAQPAITAVQTATQPYQLNNVTQFAATTAYDASGAADKVTGTAEVVHRRYDKKRDLQSAPVKGNAAETGNVVGSEDGPQPPYPIRFTGKVVRGTEQGRLQLGVPIALIENVPADVLVRLSGVYLGWAALSTQESAYNRGICGVIHEPWYPAIILVTTVENEKAAVVQRRKISIHLCHDFGNAVLFGFQLSAIIMGFLHPFDPVAVGTTSVLPDRTMLQAQMVKDVAIAERSLKRPAWDAEVTLDRIRSASSNRSIPERIADAGVSTQKRVDSIPVHRLGVRTESHGLQDRLIGSGGYFVKR